MLVTTFVVFIAIILLTAWLISKSIKGSGSYNSGSGGSSGSDYTASVWSNGDSGGSYDGFSGSDCGGGGGSD